jgi:hypothetical protein
MSTGLAHTSPEVCQPLECIAPTDDVVSEINKDDLELLQLQFEMGTILCKEFTPNPVQTKVKEETFHYFGAAVSHQAKKIFTKELAEGAEPLVALGKAGEFIEETVRPLFNYATSVYGKSIDGIDSHRGADVVAITQWQHLQNVQEFHHERNPEEVQEFGTECGIAILHEASIVSVANLQRDIARARRTAKVPEQTIPMQEVENQPQTGGFRRAAGVILSRLHVA